MFGLGKRYKTRQQTKKLEKAAALLDDVFKAFKKLMECDREDPEVLDLLKDKLEMRLDEVEEDKEEGRVERKLTTLLLKHFGGEGLDSTEEEEESEETGETEVVQEEMQDEETPSEEDAAPEEEEEEDETATALETTTQVATALEHTLQEAPQPVEKQPTAPSSPLPVTELPFQYVGRRLARSTLFFADDEDVPTSSNRDDSRVSSSTSHQEAPSTDQSSRRLTRSSQDLAQLLLRTSGRPSHSLDESVVCLGTPTREPVEVITLENTPPPFVTIRNSLRRTPNSVITRDFYADRRHSVPMEMSSPQRTHPEK